MVSKGRSTARSTAWTSARWVRYFLENRVRLLPVPWAGGAALTAREKAAIESSIAEFQLGESSDGSRLKAAADQYARTSGDDSYRRSIDLFIAEENRHARELGRFMDLESIPRRRFSVVDLVFSRLRRQGGLEVAIIVLVTAEIIAQVYYRALLRATRSSILRALCAQILRDEREHVRFQCERLALLRQDRPRVLVELATLAHRMLIESAISVVWLGHRRALRAGSLDFQAFRSRVWSYAEKALSMADPLRVSRGGLRNSRGDQSSLGHTVEAL